MTTQTTKWEPTFHRTIDKGDGVKIDMYILVDDPTGEKMVTLGVPHGCGNIAALVCMAMNGVNQ
jgi:hypothetical protein